MMENDFYRSNLFVLCLTCGFFTSFVIAEILGALFGHSLSLLGDVVAMSIDVVTYLINIWVEKIRSSGKELSINQHILFDVYVPSFSLFALLGVTTWITVEALDVIVNGSSEVKTNVTYLWAFSSCNLIIDLISTIFFYLRGRHRFGPSPPLSPIPSTPSTEVLSNHSVNEKKIIDSPENQRTNINMMSALTHVGGDTLRSVSVFIAALISTLTGVSPSLCDAWAAVIVTLTVLAIALPLSLEIYKAAHELFPDQSLPSHTHIRESTTTNSSIPTILLTVMASEETDKTSQSDEELNVNHVDRQRIIA